MKAFLSFVHEIGLATIYIFTTKKKDAELQQIVNVDKWIQRTADFGPVRWSLGNAANNIVEITESRPRQLSFAVMGKSLDNSSPGLKLQCANMKEKNGIC